ncbi:hypothetical protein, partial [Treponema pallidum]|uniref:hypothetical protein n=1 Tax=Treponema pallidum TaxID=160 RepID=UPI00244E8EF0
KHEHSVCGPFFQQFVKAPRSYAVNDGNARVRKAPAVPVSLPPGGGGVRTKTGVKMWKTVQTRSQRKR